MCPLVSLSSLWTDGEGERVMSFMRVARKEDFVRAGFEFDGWRSATCKYEGLLVSQKHNGYGTFLDEWTLKIGSVSHGYITISELTTIHELTRVMAEAAEISESRRWERDNPLMRRPVA